MTRSLTQIIPRITAAFLPSRGRNTFLWNPWRRLNPRVGKVRRWMLAPLTRLGLACGFTNIDYSYVHGSLDRVQVGRRCSIMNTTFNVVSGSVVIGDDTLFSHGCYVLTGVHKFHEGRRASLNLTAPYQEVPSSGRDIFIGRGCFIGANASILGGLTIGDNVIIGAGAVVTSDVPSGVFVAGVPAKVIGPV